MARWSEVSVRVTTSRKATPPVDVSTGVRVTAPTARIATCRGLMTAVKEVTPNIPSGSRAPEVFVREEQHLHGVSAD
jgi:hypothetical protein